MNIVPGDLSRAIEDLLTGYEGNVEEAVRHTVQSVTRNAAKRLRETAPKDTGEYAQGWTATTEQNRIGVSGIVYNKSKPGVAHLLEQGRAAGTAGGRRYPAAPAYPHIGVVADWAENEAVNRLEAML